LLKDIYSSPDGYQTCWGGRRKKRFKKKGKSRAKVRMRNWEDGNETGEKNQGGTTKIQQVLKGPNKFAFGNVLESRGASCAFWREKKDDPSNDT